MQATARRLSVVSATSCARRRLRPDVGPEMKKQEIWETTEYWDAVLAIRFRLKEILGTEPRIIFDAYATDETGMPVDNLDEVVHQGEVIVEDDVFEEYVGVPIRNPTWIDLVREGERMIDANGDEHHVFLTGFYKLDIEPSEPQRIAFNLGS
jgi:hypothetical protein